MSAQDNIQAQGSIDWSQFQQNPLDTQSGGQANNFYQYPYYQHPAPCPSCGHCPTCGRGGYRTQPWQPNIALTVPTTTTGTFTSCYMQEVQGAISK